MKRKTTKTLTELLIDLNECNRRLELIRTDEEYIQKKVDAIFKGKKYGMDRDEINQILSELL